MTHTHTHTGLQPRKRARHANKNPLTAKTLGRCIICSHACSRYHCVCPSQPLKATHDCRSHPLDPQARTRHSGIDCSRACPGTYGRDARRQGRVDGAPLRTDGPGRTADKAALSRQREAVGAAATHRGGPAASTRRRLAEGGVNVVLMVCVLRCDIKEKASPYMTNLIRLSYSPTFLTKRNTIAKLHKNSMSVIKSLEHRIKLNSWNGSVT